MERTWVLPYPFPTWGIWKLYQRWRQVKQHHTHGWLNFSKEALQKSLAYCIAILFSFFLKRWCRVCPSHVLRALHEKQATEREMFLVHWPPCFFKAIIAAPVYDGRKVTKGCQGSHQVELFPVWQCWPGLSSWGSAAHCRLQSNIKDSRLFVGLLDAGSFFGGKPCDFPWACLRRNDSVTASAAASTPMGSEALMVFLSAIYYICPFC